MTDLVSSNKIFPTKAWGYAVESVSVGRRGSRNFSLGMATCAEVSWRIRSKSEEKSDDGVGGMSYLDDSVELTDKKGSAAMSAFERLMLGLSARPTGQTAMPAACPEAQAHWKL